MAGTGLPPAHALPRDLWRWRVDLDRVALLDDDGRLRMVGLPPPLPTASQWLDLRGHGGSSPPGTYSLELMRSDVLRFLHALDLDDVCLIGHSLGGAVAYLVAAAEPKRVRLLVLEEPAPPLPARPPREVPPRPDGTLSFDWRVVEAITKQRNDPDPAWWNDLRHITARTLVIAGGPDSHLPQDQLAALADRIPDSSYLTIDVGHDVHSTHPEAFLAALLPLLTR